MGVAGDDGHFLHQVYVGEGLLDDGIKRLRLFGIPAGEVDEAGIDPFALQQVAGVPGSVCLADAGEHFAHREQVVLQFEVPVLA